MTYGSDFIVNSSKEIWCFKSLKNCFVILQLSPRKHKKPLICILQLIRNKLFAFISKGKDKSITRSSFLALTYTQDVHSRLKIKPEKTKTPNQLSATSFLMETVLSCILHNMKYNKINNINARLAGLF